MDSKRKVSQAFKSSGKSTCAQTDTSRCRIKNRKEVKNWADWEKSVKEAKVRTVVPSKKKKKKKKKKKEEEEEKENKKKKEEEEGGGGGGRGRRRKEEEEEE
jgi:hypothetical protein